MLKIADIIRSGTVAGIRAGDSYENIVKVLGLSELYNTEDIHPGCQYGDLEIYFSKTRSGLVANLIYFNSGYGHIQLDATIPFDNQGLAWGMSVNQVCEWFIKHEIPFSYNPRQSWAGGLQNADDCIELILPDARQCVISTTLGLSEIYISLLRHQAVDA